MLIVICNRYNELTKMFCLFPLRALYFADLDGWILHVFCALLTDAVINHSLYHSLG